jgi:hypothetical protein
MRSKRPGANENKGESKVGCQTKNIFCTFDIDKSKKIVIIVIILTDMHTHTDTHTRL